MICSAHNSGDYGFARASKAREAGGEVDAVTEDIVFIDDNIAFFNADAKQHQFVGWLAMIITSTCMLDGEGCQNRSACVLEFQ